MTKSELIGLLMQKNNSLSLKHIEEAVKAILEQMSCVLENGERIEVRGFGSFS